MSLDLFRSNFEVIIFVLIRYCSSWHKQSYHECISCFLNPFCCGLPGDVFTVFVSTFFNPVRDIRYSLQQLYFSAKFLWALVKGLNTLLRKCILCLYSSSENVKCMWGGGDGWWYLCLHVSYLWPLPSLSTWSIYTLPCWSFLLKIPFCHVVYYVRAKNGALFSVLYSFIIWFVLPSLWCATMHCCEVM